MPLLAAAKMRWPALCLIHSLNETLFFTSMA
ncbi:hypothetical protein predicted by Glimmer/Critica [Salmonella enterica subsp. enterica serovar Weltevreden str. 2007-60-3289-1]|nr:hypothetical protein predicted by Glimmer/Critica [Salmonella enterica subsp. enterica serovar Weltevreden str. 2007-60-3289-1]